MIVLLAHSVCASGWARNLRRAPTALCNCLAIGALINSAANVATSFLHAAGRPDVSAKLQMIELPLYLPLVWWLVQGLGIEGAALAWVLRIAVDSALLLYIAVRSMPVENSIQWEVANAGSTATPRNLIGSPPILMALLLAIGLILADVHGGRDLRYLAGDDERDTAFDFGAPAAAATGNPGHLSIGECRLHKRDSSWFARCSRHLLSSLYGGYIPIFVLSVFVLRGRERHRPHCRYTEAI
jgi:hypothetical protein